MRLATDHFAPGASSPRPVKRARPRKEKTQPQQAEASSAADERLAPYDSPVAPAPVELAVEVIKEQAVEILPAPLLGRVIEIGSRRKTAPKAQPVPIETDPAPSEPRRAFKLPRAVPPIDWNSMRNRAQAVGQGAVALGSQAHRSVRRLSEMTSAWLAPRRQEDALRVTEESAKNRTLFNRLSAAAVLSEAEAEVVDAASSSVRRTYQAGSEITIEGEVTPRPMFIVSGWACRRRTLSNGRSQFIGFLLPGDGIGLRGCAEPLAGCTIEALTTVETVDASRLLLLAEQPQRFGGIAHALQRNTVLEEELLTNQIIRLGSLSPVERLAHLLLELHFRLQSAGLATDQEFQMPLTLETLSVALGVNVRTATRLVRRFNQAGLAKWRYGRTSLAPAQLRKMSDFRAPSTCTCGRMRMAPAHTC